MARGRGTRGLALDSVQRGMPRSQRCISMVVGICRVMWEMQVLNILSIDSIV